MQDLIRCLKKYHLTIGTVESFTGGLFAHQLTEISGVSQFYKGSLIVYSNELKHTLLKIPNELIEKYGVVSEQVALKMAENGQKELHTDIAISFTGNAGPIPMENKPVGLVYIAIAYKEKKICETIQFLEEDSRSNIKEKSIKFAKEKLIHFIRENEL